jgi:hypothetical protein
MAHTTWAHYDAATTEFTWTAAETKTKRAEVLPLAGRPPEIIRSLHASRRLHCRFVFHGPRCAPGVADAWRATAAPAQRTVRKKLRRSSMNRAGCSMAAKWPPRGMTAQCVTL